MTSESAREETPSIAGLEACVRCAGRPVRTSAGRLRGMDLSVRHHAAHGATLTLASRTTSLIREFAGRGLTARRDELFEPTDTLPCAAGPVAALPQSKAADDRHVFAVDVSNWLRPDADERPSMAAGSGQTKFLAAR
ncbi:hypothetical protein [Kitasatospora sp. NPDC002522]